MSLARWLFAVILTLETSASSRAVPKPAPANAGDNELHIVGIYDGFNKTDEQIHGPKAIVKVDRPNKQVTLVLTSHSPVTWEVDAGKDTKIAKVILGGYGRQAVKGLPGNVTIVDASAKKSESPLPYAYKIDTSSFRQLITKLAKLSPVPASSFQGTYRAEAGDPFVIDKVEDDPRLSTDYPKAIPLADLPKLSFKAHHFLPDSRFPHFLIRQASYGTFTLAGAKIDDLKPLPSRVNRVTFDPVGKRYYGVRGHEIVEMDLDLKKAAKMDLGLDVPELSWPSGITFDTKRGRVILASFGGEGFLYSYHPKMGKWSTISSLNNIDLLCLAYNDRDDCLYGLQISHDEKVVLTRFNTDGAVLKNISWLASDMRDGMAPDLRGPAMDLIAVDGRIVLLAPDHLYLVDKETGKLRRAGKR